jgi:hypothetical protein
LPEAPELQVSEKSRPVKLVIPSILFVRVTRLIGIKFHRILARVLWDGVMGGIVKVILEPENPKSR